MPLLSIELTSRLLLQSSKRHLKVCLRLMFIFLGGFHVFLLVNTPPVPLSKSMSDMRYPANFVGYNNENRLIYIRSNNSIISSLNSSKVVSLSWR